jgi:hypothetical protein
MSGWRSTICSTISLHGSTFVTVDASGLVTNWRDYFDSELLRRSFIMGG